MKKIFTTLLVICASTNLFAQQSSVKPVSNNNKLGGKPANVITKGAKGAMGPTQYFIDYEGYDENFFGQIQSYVKVGFNSRDTTSGTIRQAMALIDTLVVTTDYTVFEDLSWSGLSVRIDTVYVVLGQQNNSGEMATFKVSALNYTTTPASAGNYINTTNELWSDSLVIDTNLTPTPDATGFPLTTLKFASGVTANSPFALVFEYFGNPVDTAYLRYSFPTDGTTCTGSTSPTIFASELYPQAFYSVALGAENDGSPTPSIYLPRVSGNFSYYWYNDCDDSGDPYVTPGVSTSGFVASENSYQAWSLWALVTISDFIGIEEQDLKGINVYSFPNPAADAITISYQLKQESNIIISIADVCGKTVRTENLGTKLKGKNQVLLDVNELQNGIYSYTIHTGNQQITRKFTVNR